MLLIWVERFFKLWSRNQWKRERYAPSFHLDDHNLDPRSWMRFPILSGGFEKELAEMKAWANEQKPNGRKGKIGFLAHIPAVERPGQRSRYWL